MSALEIAIVTKDRPKILEKTLRNIISKTDGKIIVIDGSSNQKTKDVCANIEVEYHKQKSNGMTAARNEALNYCQSKYIAFVDDDVRVSSNWYEKIETEIKAKDVVGVTGKLEDEYLELSYSVKMFRDYLFGSRENFGEILDNGVINGDFFYDERKEVDHMPGCNMAYDVETLKECGGFEEAYDVGNSYREDTVASYKVSKKGKIIYDPEASLNHIKADEGRNEKKRLFYNTYLTRYFLTDQNIVKGFRNTLSHLFVTLTRHGYYFSRSLRNLDSRYIFYLKGEIKGIIDFIWRDKEPQSHI